MKQEKINRAFSSLIKLRDMNLPVKKAYAIYKINSALEDAYNFALNEERKYLSEFGGVITDDGDIKFGSPEDLRAFMEKLEELNTADVEVDTEVVSLSENDLGSQMLTPGDIYNLEGFVIFE